MKLFINEELLETEKIKCQNLGQIIALVEQEHLPPSHVITTVKLNGVTLSMEEEKSFADTYPYERIESLEILTADPSSLMLEAFADASGVLEDILTFTREVVEKIRQGEVDQAITLFQKCLELMQWFNDILRLTTKQAKIDYTQIEWKSNGGSAANLNLKLLNVYGDIIEAQQNNDWINLSDILDYEFIPIIRNWQEFLPTFTVYLEEHLKKQLS